MKTFYLVSKNADYGKNCIKIIAVITNFKNSNYLPMKLYIKFEIIPHLFLPQFNKLHYKMFLCVQY